jgi:hypothetical protein
MGVWCLTRGSRQPSLPGPWREAEVRFVDAMVLLDESPEPPGVLLVELSGPIDPAIANGLRTIRSRLPEIRLVGLVSDSAALDQAAALRELGVCEWQLPDPGGALLLLPVQLPDFLSVRAPRLPRQSLRLGRAALLEAILRAPANGLNVNQVAKSLGVGSRTLRAAFEAEGLGSPHFMIRAARLAAFLRQHPGTAERGFAQAIGYADTPSMRRSFRTLVKKLTSLYATGHPTAALIQQLFDLRIGAVDDASPDVATSTLSHLPRV